MLHAQDSNNDRELNNNNKPGVGDQRPRIDIQRIRFPSKTRKTSTTTTNTRPFGFRWDPNGLN